jgi:hypothetical protein
MNDFPYYILIGKRVFKTDINGFMRWSRKRGGSASQTLALTRVSPTVDISTIFICIDHRHFGEGRPIVFETLVFGGQLDGEMERYTTYGKALDGHERMVIRVRKGIVNEALN